MRCSASIHLTVQSFCVHYGVEDIMALCKKKNQRPFITLNNDITTNIFVLIYKRIKAWNLCSRFQELISESKPPF